MPRPVVSSVNLKALNAQHTLVCSTRLAITAYCPGHSVLEHSFTASQHSLRRLQHHKASSNCLRALERQSQSAVSGSIRRSASRQSTSQQPGRHTMAAVRSRRARAARLLQRAHDCSEEAAWRGAGGGPHQRAACNGGGSHHSWRVLFSSPSPPPPAVVHLMHVHAHSTSRSHACGRRPKAVPPAALHVSSYLSARG